MVLVCRVHFADVVQALLTQALFRPCSTETHTVFVCCADGVPGALPDRIFVSAGTEVKAFTKKGKQFLSFDSNLAEPIRNMYA